MNIKELIDTEKITERGIIHGEMIILPIKEIPKNLASVQKGHGVIVGHSETGHHHVIEGVAEAFAPKTGNVLYFVATRDTTFKHLKTFDRHEDMPIFGGQPYIALNKSEFDPFLDVLRKVRD
jgi:hypothetical protein